MPRYLKTICLIICIIFAVNITSYAAAANTTTDPLLDEFKDDTDPLDDSVLKDDITISIDESSDLSGVIELIKSDPKNSENYDKAAELFTLGNESGIKVFSDGVQIDFSKYNNVLPVIDNGRTMVPVRALAESLGAVVNWEDSKKLATINLGDKVIELTIDSKVAKVNKKDITLDVPAKSNSGRIMIPLRFVSENFGKKVGWHPYTKGVNVISITD